MRPSGVARQLDEIATKRFYQLACYGTNQLTLLVKRFGRNGNKDFIGKRQSTHFRENSA